MWLSSLNLFTWRKVLCQRIATYVAAVFVLQIVAAGVCLPAVNAAPVMAKQLEKSHCMAAMTDKPMMEKGADSASHTCVHCDMPDLVLMVDKHLTNVDVAAVEQLFVVVLPSARTMQETDYKILSPPLRTSLFNFDLNRRIRV